MTMIYEVSVERIGFGYCRHFTIAHQDNRPELAAEAGEREAARELYGDDWAKVIHQFFAYKVRPLTAAEFLQL